MQDSVEILSNLRGYKPQSDLHQFKEFIGSGVHLDFRNEVVARMLHMQSTLSDALNNDVNEILRTQGGLVAMTLVLNIFENLRDNKESDLKFEEISDEKDVE